MKKSKRATRPKQVERVVRRLRGILTAKEERRFNLLQSKFDEGFHAITLNELIEYSQLAQMAVSNWCDKMTHKQRA